MTPEQFTDCLLNEINYYVDKGLPYVSIAKTAAAADLSIQDIWLDPARDMLIVRRASSEPGTKLAGLDTVYCKVTATQPDTSWCGLVISAGKTASLWENVQGATGWNDKFYPPSPLAAMLATGVLGAGLGYGGAALLSGLLPNTWDKRKLRRSGALLGAAIGAAPGGLETAKSVLIRQPVLDGSHMTHLKKQADIFGQHQQPSRYAAGQIINAEQLKGTVWRSPMVSQQLTNKEKSLFTGAMTSSQMIAGSPYITPVDIARLTAGMGVGYASGLVAGRVLGTLTGMPLSSQNTLANTGMYAGAIKATLPMLFGYR